LKKDNNKGLKTVCTCLFYIYIIVLLYFLFFSERYGRECTTRGYRYNLEFLKEIKRFIRYRKQLGLESFVVNILGNVLAFTPLGFLLPFLHKKYDNFICVLLLSMMFSLTVELLQLVSKVGIFDVDDILLNSIGGVMGYFLFAIGSCFFERFHRKRIKTGGRCKHAKK
jgi:glycopeptide antibiotics resistance protein